jgi:hypothetical protein
MPISWTLRSRMERRAHRRDEERRRHLLTIEHAQDARQAVDGAVFAARQHLVVEIALRQRHRGVVDVERQRHGDAVVPRPRRRLQPPPGAHVEHLALQLVEALGDTGQRVRPRGRRWRRRRLGLPRLSAGHRHRRRQGGSRQSECSCACHPRASVRAPPRALAMCSADRKVTAANVNVPLVQPAVGRVGDPTTNRFSWSCVRP